MAILQPVIERKLSSLLGADVSFEQLNISLLSSSIEAIGVKAGDFLTVARVVAKAAVARALKGEIVVSSVTIEKPIVNIAKLPKRAAKSKTTPESKPTDVSDDKTR